MRKIDYKSVKKCQMGGALSLLNKDNVTKITLIERSNMKENSILNTSLFRVFFRWGI